MGKEKGKNGYRKMTKLELRYVRLSDLVLWDRNPKRHDIGAIIESLRRHGMRDPAAYDATLGALVYGNGRTQAMAQMKRGKEAPPAMVEVAEDGEWLVPVVFGADSKSLQAAESFAIDHNNLTMMGSDFTAYDIEELWDSDKYVKLLEELAADAELPVTVDGDDLEALVAAPVAIEEKRAANVCMACGAPLK